MTELINDSFSDIGLGGTVAETFAALNGSYVSTLIEVGGGIVLGSANTIVGITEVPELLGAGAWNIHQAIEEGDVVRGIEGLGQIIEGASRVADVGMSVAGAIKAPKAPKSHSAAPDPPRADHAVPYAE